MRTVLKHFPHQVKINSSGEVEALPKCAIRTIHPEKLETLRGFLEWCPDFEDEIYDRFNITDLADIPKGFEDFCLEYAAKIKQIRHGI